MTSVGRYFHPLHAAWRSPVATVSSETVAKLARFMCGRAIKPVRPVERKMTLLEISPLIAFTCDGPMARRHRMPGKRLRHSAGSQLSFATASDDLRHRPKIQALTAVDPGHYSRPAFESSTSCTNSQPKRPLMHRWPRVTSASRGEVTLTIRLSWTCKVSVQPTPQ